MPPLVFQSIWTERKDMLVIQGIFKNRTEDPNQGIRQIPLQILYLFRYIYYRMRYKADPFTSFYYFDNVDEYIQVQRPRIGDQTVTASLIHVRL